LKNHPVRDWLDLLGNVVEKRNALFKNEIKNERSDLIILIRNNFKILYIG